MSQPSAFEYTFITLPAATGTTWHDRAANQAKSQPFGKWLDDQANALSEILTAQYAGWEVMSHDVYFTGDTKLLSVLLRRPIHIQS